MLAALTLHHIWCMPASTRRLVITMLHESLWCSLRDHRFDCCECAATTGCTTATASVDHTVRNGLGTREREGTLPSNLRLLHQTPTLGAAGASTISGCPHRHCLRRAASTRGCRIHKIFIDLACIRSARWSTAATSAPRVDFFSSRRRRTYLGEAGCSVA